jgi:hypothetical protein
MTQYASALESPSFHALLNEIVACATWYKDESIVPSWVAAKEAAAFFMIKNGEP